MDNLIYYICGNSTYCNKLNVHGVKIGSTQNIYSRIKTYQTGYPDEVPLVCYYKINKNCYQVDYDIQQYFNDIRLNSMGSTGGTEFYSAEILTEKKLEKWFFDNNIGFEKYYLDSVFYSICKNPIDYQDIINISNDVINKNSIVKDTFDKELALRNELQKNYITDIIWHLNTYKKAFLKAPTGFGKTHVYYKVIQQMKFKRILFLTPRILLNQQIVEDKYSSYIKDDNYKIIHFSDLDNASKERKIKKYSKNNEKIIMTSCYQSGKRLLEYLNTYKFSFDLIIFDEAHFISSWADGESISEFLTSNTICSNRLFGSATPTEDIELKPQIYGKIIEKVKVYELINKELLCNIETIVKQMSDKKSEYHNLKDLIVECMVKYKKKKGIIYVNDCKNAENLYNLLKEQNKINVYIYVSKNIEVENDTDADIKSFEQDKAQCVIIAVGKIGYGYDNDYIDFICLGDSRQSDIDIRQIIGRGLRWKKNVYPNKLLHLLVPIYRDEFGNCGKNEHLKKYLDYIIGECGKDIIFKSNGDAIVANNAQEEKEGKDYSGDNIPTEILNEYCTTGYNKYTDFLKFLKSNQIYDEISYNKLREKQKQNWMIDLGGIQTKYKNFCFRHVHPNNINYYWDKNEAIKAYEIANNELINQVGKEKYRRYNAQQKLEKANELDNKIPLINFDLYYPKD